MGLDWCVRDKVIPGFEKKREELLLQRDALLEGTENKYEANGSFNDLLGPSSPVGLAEAQ